MHWDLDTMDIHEVAGNGKVFNRKLGGRPSTQATTPPKNPWAVKAGR
jgi:hypothetical protein